MRCDNIFLPFFVNLNPEDLVTSSGKLKYEIFFGGKIENNWLTENEANELVRFVNSGGILYISGGSPNEDGAGYNILFEKFGLGDRFTFTTEYQTQTYSNSSLPLQDTLTSKGPFGSAITLKHSAFKVFNIVDLNEIYKGNGGVYALIAEKEIGKGYLIVSGHTLYRDNYLYQNSNKIYFLNMFAMACNRNTVPEKILDVPSLKQGLVPYDSVSPVWESDYYDDGDKQTLGCGSKFYQCGCALTSAAMVMNYWGVYKDPTNNPVNPRFVNNFFKQSSKKLGSSYSSWGFSNGDFRWNRVGEYSKLANSIYSGQTKLDQMTREDFSIEKAKQYIDSGYPLIVKTKNSYGGVHWVVIKGYKGDELVINDPVKPDIEGTYATFSTSGLIPYTNDSMIKYQPANSDYSSIEFVTNYPVHILVTDQLGRQTGFDSVTDTVKEDIPNSQYIYDEDYSNIADGINSPSLLGVHSLLIHTPLTGKYKVQIIGNPANYSLYVSDKDANSNFYVFESNENEITEFVYDSEKIVNFKKTISIDIRPLSKKNYVWSKIKLPIPVGILSSKSFNPVKDVVKKSLRFGKTGSENSLMYCFTHATDMNNDDIKDLLCYFDSRKTGFSSGDKTGILKGLVTQEIIVEGTDGIYYY